MDDDIDSTCSTPFASAPSSPGRSPAIFGGGGYFFSAPASPIHHLLFSSASGATNGGTHGGHLGDAEFEFGGPGEHMISADELFQNGQIRPLTLSPLPDLDPGSDGDGGGDDDGAAEAQRPARRREPALRSGSVHRRARSMSPTRSASPRLKLLNALVPAPDLARSTGAELEAPPPVTASSRSSSSSSTSSSSSASSARGSRRWVVLKDMLLHRSKSEPGSGHAHDAPAAAKPEKSWQFSHSWASREKVIARLRGARPSPPSETPVAAAESGIAGAGEESRTTTRGHGRGKGRRRLLRRTRGCTLRRTGRRRRRCGGARSCRTGRACWAAWASAPACARFALGESCGSCKGLHASFTSLILFSEWVRNKKGRWHTYPR